MPARQPSDDPLGGLAPLGIAAVAVVCCAALPLVAALAGSVAIGTVLGIGAGLVAAVLLVGLLLAHVRRRRACEPPGAAPKMRDALDICLRPEHLRRTVTIALVVGTILTAINEADVIARGDATSTTLAKAVLNYLVPFVVSNLGLLAGRPREQR